MQVYHDDLQKWWDFSPGLMNFLLLVHFRLSEMDQIWVFWKFARERMDGIAWKGRTEAYFRLFALSPV